MFPCLVLVFWSCIVSIDGGVSFVDLSPSVGGENSNPKLNVGPALRYLTKGVFTKALLKGRFYHWCRNIVKWLDASHLIL